MKLFQILLSVSAVTAPSITVAQQKPPATVVAGIPVNYEELLVGNYTLPDPLVLLNGKKVTDSKTWLQKRRPEIIKLYEDNQFGKAPGRPAGLSFQVFDTGTPAFDGKALRKQVRIYFTKDTADQYMDLLIYLPAKATQPVPLLLNVSFSANMNAARDSGIRPGMVWNKEGKKVPATRSAFGQLDVEKFMDAGFGIATVCYTDIEPDFKNGIQYGIRSLYLKPGATQVAANEWGAIAAWAWGLSRAMDYFETDKDIDTKRIAVTGASRLGKTALWTGASDTRFAMVIASISGEGGAAISRRNYGETVAHITDTSRYFYQFAPNYHTYSNKLHQLPVDGHMLLSLIAPRPLLLQTGDTDVWSDPKGEFVAAVAAEPVYRLFGKQGPGTTEMPQAGDSSLLHPLGYYMHTGGHTVLPGDWDVFLRFMKKYL